MEQGRACFSGKFKLDIFWNTSVFVQIFEQEVWSTCLPFEIWKTNDHHHDYDNLAQLTTGQVSEKNPEINFKKSKWPSYFLFSNDWTDMTNQRFISHVQDIGYNQQEVEARRLKRLKLILCPLSLIVVQEQPFLHHLFTLHPLQSES